MKNKLENFKTELHVLSLKQQNLTKGGDGPTLPDRNSVVDWNSNPTNNWNHLLNISGDGLHIITENGDKRKLYVL